MMISTGNKSPRRWATYRVPKIVTIAIISSMLVATAGIAASASPNLSTTGLGSGALSLEAGSSFTYVNFAHRGHPKPPDATTTTAPATSTTAPVSTTTAPVSTTTAPVSTTTAPVSTTTAPVSTTTAPAPTTSTTDPSTTTTVGSSSPQPVGSASGPWNMIFDSEFSGTSLDTSQWSTGWFGSGITKGVNSAEEECMDPSQVTVSGGALNLAAIPQQETCNGVTQPYTSGMVTTDGHFSFTYGYMEAKIWMPGTSRISDWPAFWADGQSWPTDGENDVVEGLGGLAQAHFHNSAGADGPLTGSGSFTGGWHTFAADWEPGSVTYYYDGVNIGTFTSGITSAPMYLILDMAVSGPTTSIVPATMKVAYVRVWQH